MDWAGPGSTERLKKKEKKEKEMPVDWAPFLAPDLLDTSVLDLVRQLLGDEQYANVRATESARAVHLGENGGQHFLS